MTTKYEYVMSGMNYAMSKRGVFTDAYNEKCREMFRQLNGAIPNHSQAILFNGLQERSLGKHLYNIYGTESKYYVDSGGLQMVTLGMEATDETREDIYKTQGEFGDFAMSFDEIPVKLLSDRSTFHDTKSRVVDMENFDEFAVASGKNLRAQIESFKRQKTKTKPFMIVQGTSPETYQRWTDLVLGEVDPSDHCRIGGLSVGAASLGQGQMEDFTRAFLAATLEMPEHIKAHIHLLGVGSLKRLAPIVALKHAGHFENTLISYDSTTHTSSLSLGSFQKDHRLMGFKVKSGNVRGFDAVVDEICAYAKKVFKMDPDPEFIRFVYLHSRAGYYERWGHDREEEYQDAKFLSLYANILNFCKSLRIMDWGPEGLMEVFPEKTGPYLTFCKVQDRKDFDQWQRLNSAMLVSKAIATSDSVTTLDELFE
ncbi:hypothetical protein FDI24_gp123 [Acidovorax phage ACP17]|uniref:Uncharacterized protein n=1 Tax=Acidovorax phage ACP17 TaxID=2010329 RepID=A0A218M2Y9_9CAUD|nr:hypothetical protein FDI24_gp123 [Acidovorax phage ACP17]ASD50403.1 hypothetical protein [Acidovorax phage ACP17]